MSQKVVVVEDNSLLSAQYKRVLEKAGIDVRIAESSSAAIDTIDDTIPDVILLDVLLKGPNAFTLLHELRSHRDLASIPVVLITSLAGNFTLSQLSSYGVVDMLDKASMHPDDVLRVVRRWT